MQVVSTVEELYRFVANANEILDAKIDSEIGPDEAPVLARAADVPPLPYPALHYPWLHLGEDVWKEGV